ncbi:hypothetical protein BDZ91DRAFT_345261 [Kalaharituber pfeilii]|nr:hypothetical protein BDZ91DRAFT_345261 [Kalaharituber pfeilii]
MDISGLLTEDLPARSYRTPPATCTPYRSLAPTPQQLSPIDEPKQTVFHCSTHARIPLRLELRPNLTSADIDTLVRTFFGLNAGDVITYDNGDQKFATVGYDECMRTPEFHIHVTPDLRYQQHPFAPSQANARHPSAHISGYGLSTRSQIVSTYTARSISPSSGRGRRSGSTNGTIGGRSRSMKRQTSGHSHPPVEELVDEYVHDHKLYQQQPHLLHGVQADGKLTKIEPVASAEISLDNIVEGSRRKRAKFSSAELPLFPKPLHPASYSPSRPANTPQTMTPLQSNQYTYYQQNTPNSTSPYSYSSNPSSYYSGRQCGPNFPTPAPTIATDISDEDVALQLMRLGEASTTSNSPSNNDETADDIGNYSEDQVDEFRSDTTELPELPPPMDEYEDSVDLSPSYPKNQKKYKSLNEILPSYDSTIPSDNEETQSQTPISIKQEPIHCTSFTHNHNHSHHQGDSADEEDFDCDDAGDETYVVEKDEDDDGDYMDDEQRPHSRASYGTSKQGFDGHGKYKSLNQVKAGRVGKPLQKVAKPKPKPTTTLYTAFNNASKATVGKGPLSPASPTLHRTHSISSNPSLAQKSRSTTASISSLPTPISGIIPQHPDSFNPNIVLLAQDEDPEKPKPRCQRCRKSKKGCDRQRPCQRCKDAGIGIEGCISEDETGTRRGRAGAAKKAGIAGAGVKKAVKPKKKITTKH